MDRYVIPLPIIFHVNMNAWQTQYEFYISVKSNIDFAVFFDIILEYGVCLYLVMYLYICVHFAI